MAYEIPFESPYTGMKYDPFMKQSVFTWNVIYQAFESSFIH